MQLIPPPKEIKFVGEQSEIFAASFLGNTLTKSTLEKLPEFIIREPFPEGQNSQAYLLDIGLKQIHICADSDQAFFFALQTLWQLAKQTEKTLPQVSIRDYPDFVNRGFMLDVSRDKIPKMELLFEYIDRLARLKYTQLQLYTEHSFAYKNHEVVWANASPLTADEVRELDIYCENRFIELLPNLNTFGHMSRWLIHEPYKQLAEQPEGGETDWGYRKEPQSLCPLDPGSIDLVEDLLDQLLPNFHSKQVNIGCDETIDLGFGKSKQAVEKKGRGRVYLEYLQKVIKSCENRGYSIQFWADIILKYPELVPEIPKGCTAMNWGYEANHPFEEETLALKKSEVPFYVCPGTSSWCSIAGRTDNMISNIESAARHGLNNGAEGFLLTDWGDYGHWQMDTITLPGLYLAAAVSWNNSADNKKHLAAQLDCFEFQATGWGQLLLDLGNVDNATGLKFHNQTLLFKLLQLKAADILAIEGINAEALRSTLGELSKLQKAFIGLCKSSSVESRTDEISWTIEMLELACERGLALLASNAEANRSITQKAMQLRDEQKRLWHVKNRPGGYPESHARFSNLIDPFHDR